MKLKKKCCKKYKKKAKLCKACPLMAALSGRERKQLLNGHRARKAKAA